MILTLLDLVRKRPLKNAPGEHVFWLYDGQAISNLRELRDAFRSMSKEQFDHHVNSNRNDFSIWIADILADGVLADDLLMAKSSLQAEQILVKHLNDWYELSHA